jgi:HEAT repeat protein
MSEGTESRTSRLFKRWWPLLAIAVLLGVSVLVIATTSRGKKAPPLPGFLEKWRTKARFREIRQLSQRTDAHAIRRLLGLMTDRNRDVCGRAAGALGAIKDPAAVEPLIAALKDTDADVRGYAAWALRRIGDERAVEPLIAALNHTDATMREGAVWALGYIKDPRAVKPLIAALKDTDGAVRSWAAQALGGIKDPRTVEPLIAALKDRDASLRGDAARALTSITGVDYGQDAEKWQKWWDENKAGLEKPEGRNPKDE